MPPIKSEFSCSICKAQTGELNQIIANAGVLQCSKNPSHRWNDTMSFYNTNPTMDFKPTLLKAQQTNHTPITVTVPLGLKTQAETKFGDKLSATVTQILGMIVEGDVMIVGQVDLDRLQERIGAKFSNSSELVGIIYAKMCEVEEAKNDRDSAVQDLKAYEDRSPGRVVVDLGDQFETAKERAKNSEPPVPIKIYVEEKLRMALKDNWF